MKKIIISFLISLVVFTTAFKCDKPFIDDNLTRIAKNGGVITSKDSRQVTDGGAVLFSYTAQPQATLDAIDAGISQRQEAAVADGFKESLKFPLSHYEIWTPAFPCKPSPEQHIMSFMVGGGWFYDGTAYDQYNPKGKLAVPEVDPVTGNTLYWKKDGLSAIFAAEMVISLGNQPHENAIMIACPDTSVVQEAVGNGVDHQWLGTYPYTEEYRTQGPYDVWQYFNDTLYHSTGKGHPLIPRNAPIIEDFATPVVSKKADTPEILSQSVVTLTEAEQKASGVPVSSATLVVPKNPIIRVVK